MKSAKIDKRVLIAGILLLFQLSVRAQADIYTSSHWYNRANYNPASIARPNYVYFFSNVRKQWVGIDGAPKVYNIQASGFSEKYNSAFGLSLIRDEIGLTTALNPSLQYAYRVGLSEKLNLALGLSAGVYTRRINTSAYQADIIDDPALDYSDEKYFSPDANFGLELQSNHFIFGLSATHLFSIWKPDDKFLITNHNYAYALYKNADSELFNFTTGIQVINRSNLTVVEGTAIIRIKRPTGLQKGPVELFDLGLTLRTSSQFTAITGINITRNLRIGYTYDFGLGNSIKSNGSHEVVLEYRIPLSTIIDNGYPWYN